MTNPTLPNAFECSKIKAPLPLKPWMFVRYGVGVYECRAFGLEAVGMRQVGETLYPNVARLRFEPVGWSLPPERRE